MNEDDVIHNNVNEYGVDNSLIENIKSALKLGLNTQIIKLVPSLHPVDQAELFIALEKEERKKLVRILGDNLEPEVLIELNKDILKEVIECIDKDVLFRILAELNVDDITYLLEEIEDDFFTRTVIESLKTNRKGELIEKSLSYPEDSVGRLMCPKDYIAVPKNWTISEVVKYIQINKNINNEISEIVIVDEYFKPISTVPVGLLLRMDKNSKMQDIMRDPTDLKVLNAEQDQSDASFLFTKYGLQSAPVVDDNGVLIGVIYLNDIINVVNEEAEEDMMLISGVNNDNIRNGIFKSAFTRFPWLITTIFTTLITSFIVNSFESTIQKLVTLVTLLPVLAGLGGVSGNQTLTILVRNLATKNINDRNCIRAIFKEGLVGLTNGVFLGIILFLITFFWHKNLSLSIVFSCAVICILILSCLIGSSVPLIIKKIGLDPAVTSSAFISTTIDVLSYSLFLFLVQKFIIGLGI